MKYIIPLLSILILFTQCENTIKDENVTIQQEVGTEIIGTPIINEVIIENIQENDSTDFWVGFFLPRDEEEIYDKYIYADEGLGWGRENKISISIDLIINDSVIGHSVVAGNDRPFYGKLTNDNGVTYFEVREPGDNKYDGVFTFKIENNTLEGTWDAFKKIDIAKRKYQLEKKKFQYDRNQMLVKDGRGYANWDKFISEKENIMVDEDTEDEELYEWVRKEFATTTNKIYEINASNKLLSKEDVENLTNSDLVVIRNTIYARHGYSFKNRPLRVFFDSQDWYIPVYHDIKKEFSEIEKTNIQLLLRYEKNAKEYYDFFGRG